MGLFKQRRAEPVEKYLPQTPQEPPHEPSPEEWIPDHKNIIANQEVIVNNQALIFKEIKELRERIEDALNEEEPGDEQEVIPDVPLPPTRSLKKRGKK